MFLTTTTKQFIDNFIYSEENSWGEVRYYPTILGKIVLGILVAAALVLAIIFAYRVATGKAENTGAKPAKARLSAKQLAFCAIAVALGTVLSNVKLYHFPTGGSITLLSMLVICLPGYFFGVGAGLMSGLAYGLLQLIIDPYVLTPLQLVIDYLFAFTALGLSGIFHKTKFGLIKGYVTAILGRYIFAVLSGWIFFGSYAWEGWNPLPYSLAYNAIYIFSEAAITLIILAIPPVSKAMGQVKKMANEA